MMLVTALACLALAKLPESVPELDVRLVGVKEVKPQSVVLPGTTNTELANQHVLILEFQLGTIDYYQCQGSNCLYTMGVSQTTAPWSNGIPSPGTLMQGNIRRFAVILDSAGNAPSEVVASVTKQSWSPMGVMPTVTASFTLNINRISCADASIDTRRGYGDPDRDGAQVADPNSDLRNLNFGGWIFKGGLFVGNMPRSSGDRSGTARIQLFPTSSFSNVTVSRSNMQFATLVLFANGTGGNNGGGPGGGDVPVDPLAPGERAVLAGTITPPGGGGDPGGGGSGGSHPGVTGFGAFCAEAIGPGGGSLAHRESTITWSNRLTACEPIGSNANGTGFGTFGQNFKSARYIIDFSGTGQSQFWNWQLTLQPSLTTLPNYDTPNFQEGITIALTNETTAVDSQTQVWRYFASREWQASPQDQFNGTDPHLWWIVFGGNL